MRLRTGAEKDNRWLRTVPGGGDGVGIAQETYVSDDEIVEYRMHLGNDKPRERRWIITVVDVETGETATGFAAAGEQRKKTNELLDQLRCDVA